MSRKIIGVTVGTAISPAKVEKEIKPVKSVNGITPDENGDVSILGGNGQDGADGFSPIATVTQTASGATITITDKNGTTTANVNHGHDGIAGADGVSPVVGVTEVGDGYELTITDLNGTKSVFVSNGTVGADGVDGADGKDGNGIKSAVLNANYTLTLTFDDGTSYTTPSIRGATGPKGEKGNDGNTSVLVMTKAEYSELTAAAVAQFYVDGIRLIVVEDGYTNLVPTSTDAAGNVYRGCGYLNGYRLTSKGGLAVSDNCCVSGFMPYTHGSTIRIVGSCGDVLTNGGQYVGVYDASYNLVKIDYASSIVATWNPRADGLWEMTIDTSKMTAWSGAKYFRVSCVMCVGADMVVTVNEPIGLEV